ncbi:MAG: hypothetical protein Q8N23_09610 [Archangium sp.]|nr:hypothetical protein [Archangium sp.]MDP3152917.1 hypothetical protein [Archangium sp.]MDP3569925.1 hypothetical protein [Archangium sp.]
MAPAKSCSAASCEGCCTESGDCLAGTAVFECGAGGGACSACAANEVCQAGACGVFENGDYDASFPELPDASIRYDAGVYRPPDSGVVTVDGGTDAGPMTVSYAAQIQPIFDARCDSCHSWSYDTIVSMNGRIIPGNLNGSGIYTRTLGGDMPRGGGAPLTATQQTLLRDWILNGAPRN